MNLIFIILIISISISLYVLFPIVRRSLFKQVTEIEIPAHDPEYTRLLREKEQVLNDIKDIDLDYGLEKLDESDFIELRNKYRAMAADIIEKLESYENKQGIYLDPAKEKSLEDEIERRKTEIRNR